MTCPSLRRAEVCCVRMRPHPDADKLSLVEAYGHQVVVNSEDWKNGQLAAFIPPDSVVDTSRPEFRFLGDGSKVRVKARRLRGVLSEGLLVPAPFGLQEGDDAAPVLGVGHWNEPEDGDTWHEKTVTVKGSRPENDRPGKAPPGGDRPVYDVESWKRYRHVFEKGNEVVVTEKIHGQNARYSYVPGEGNGFFAGSRGEWKQPHDDNPLWGVLARCAELRAWLSANPGYTVYGEVYGKVKGYPYDTLPGLPRFRAFDVLAPGGRWLDWDEQQNALYPAGVPLVPFLYRGPYSPELVQALAEGRSHLAPHVREGVVVRPPRECRDEKIGRVLLKVINPAYAQR